MLLLCNYVNSATYSIISFCNCSGFSLLRFLVGTRELTHLKLYHLSHLTLVAEAPVCTPYKFMKYKIVL